MANTVFLRGLAIHGMVYADESTGAVHLTIPERLPYDVNNEWPLHICKEGDTLFNLAIAYYKDVYPVPCDLWEVIAQAQEYPIVDPSIPLPEGLILQIPTPDYLSATAFGQSLSSTPLI